MPSENNYKKLDALVTRTGVYPFLQSKDKKTFVDSIAAFQTIGKSLNARLAETLEKALQIFLKHGASINNIYSMYSEIAENQHFPEVCIALEKQPEVKAVLQTTCEILLSDPSTVDTNAPRGQNELYYSIQKVNEALGDILNLYEKKRTTAQKIKNVAGGLQSKYDWLYRKLLDIYKYRIDAVLKIYGAVKCVPCSSGDLGYNRALHVYDQELEQEFEAAREALAEARRPRRYTMPRTNTVSVGYVPGRGALSRSSEREGYFFRPTNEGNTGGEASNENVRAFYEARNARRKANEERWAARSTLSRSLTATPAEIEEIGRRIRAPEQGLAAIQEENESNQEGGRKRKTRKSQKGKKGTRRR